MESVLPLLYMVAISSVYFFLIPQTILTDWPACGHLLGWCRVVVRNHPFLHPLPAAKVSVEPADFGGSSLRGAHSNMRLAAVLVLCCVLAEGATKNKWKDKKCVKKQAQGLCAATNCPKKAKKCKKTATQRWLKEREASLARPRQPPPLVGSASP